MLRVTRLTDYGIVLLGRLAERGPRCCCNTRDLAAQVGLPASTVSKILKALAREGLLVSHRGIGGGYSLARDPQHISLDEIISAIEGPIAMTQGGVSGAEACPIGANWQLINNTVREALSKVTLTRMTAAPVAALTTQKKGDAQ